MGFDMNQCKPGDRILSCCGLVLIYKGRKDSDNRFPHIVEYPGGGYGSRTNDGHVYEYNRLPTDHDIIGFAPAHNPELLER